MKPLTRKGSAVTRPHVVVLFGFLIALMWALPAEAGKRGRRSKKARARAQAKAESQKRRQEPMPTPAPAVASNDDGDGARTARSGTGGAPAAGAPAKQREKVFDFSAIELGGSERMPQLLYFLDRADEELERASLERRSFVPEMMRTLDEENL